MTAFRTRRHRRTGKQVLRHGRNAKRKHRKLGGRSGSILATQLKGRR